MQDLETTIAGVPLELCPERAVFRPDRAEVLVADVHLGKAAAFRRAGRPVPKGTTARELGRIDALVARKGAERLTVLGDLFHAEVEVDGPTAARFAEWLERRSRNVEVTLVQGNHDRHARALLEALALRVEAEPWTPAAGLEYRHHPRGGGPFLAGHLHPGARLDDGADRMKLPAFWERGDGLVLPAFGAFTGLHVIEAARSDRVAVVTPRGVTAVPVELLASR